MAGGQENEEGPTDVVEFTADGINYENLVPLPIGNSGLCLVITGNNSLFIAGGQTEDGEVVSHAYTYTRGNESWTQVKRHRITIIKSKLHAYCSQGCRHGT